MFKKIYLIAFCLVFLISCGNEETDYPGGSSTTGSASTPPVSYKIFTLVFYKEPYSSEMLYPLIQLANFNKIESSFFIVLDVDDPNYKTKIENFLAKNKENINVIAMNVVPKDIPLIDKFQTLVDKAIFLFPKEKPKFDSIPTSLSSNTDTSKTPAKNTVHIFPENYNFLSTTIKLRYTMQDKSFLAGVLKFLTGGNINKPSISNIDEIAYIQGDTLSNAGLRVLQGDNLKSFKEKTNVKALEDGTITGIPIDPKQNMQIQLITDKKQTTYWIDGLRTSFLFFNFKPIDDNKIKIYSYFTPLKLDSILFAGKPIATDEDNEDKAIYGLELTIDPKANAKDESWSGEYKNGILALSISPDLLPITYNLKDDAWNLTAPAFVKNFSEIKETKKDYESRSSSSGNITVIYKKNNPQDTKVEDKTVDISVSKEDKKLDANKETKEEEVGDTEEEIED